eukprot:TRINITY_DN4255_c0_g1_i1.p1 TRINITY_DN4255_c0_g1~~TRINITY_DN4255_c0_g1_i1.p1  ORF type:complete len:573 (-),score=155.33 TRINITY_DN4255_c0_g1_i1:93-1811(-)
MESTMDRAGSEKSTHAECDLEFLQTTSTFSKAHPLLSPSSPSNSPAPSRDFASSRSSSEQDKILIKVLKNFKPANSENHLHHSHNRNSDSSPLNSPSLVRTDETPQKVSRTTRHPVTPALFFKTFNDLIARGADVNAQNEKGRTPLMYACKYGEFEIVQALLMNGANPFVEDRKGHKCLDFAKKSNKDEIRKFVRVWMKTNRPESMRIYLPNDKSLKPFLDKPFSLPKELKIDLSKREYSEFVSRLKDALSQDAVRMRNYVSQTANIIRSEENRTYNILSIDGGGVKALAPALILEKLSNAIPGLLNKVDLIVGASGGATVAAGLAYGLSPRFCAMFFEEGARKTFSDRRIGIHQAKYSRQWMKLGYYLILGNTRMKDLSKKLMIPSWKLEDDDGTWGPRFFHNLMEHPKAGQDDLVIDAILRSSAAPTYFPSYQGYIDSGVFANNPLSIALPFVIGTGRDSLGIPAENVRVFSIGTGITQYKVREHVNEESDWGLLQWGPKMLGLLFDGQYKLAEQTCSLLLPKDHYFRLDPAFIDKHTGLDDVDSMDKIKLEVEKMPLDQPTRWLEKQFH